MDYIQKRIDQFISYNISGGVSDENDVIERAQSELFDFDEDVEKLRFVQNVLEANEIEYQKHLKVCIHKDTCRKNYAFESVTYFLNKELKKLGYAKSEDQFTTVEKQEAEEKLNIILADLQNIKDGQEVLFKEIQELKNLFILGKKNWKQLLLGKMTEMTLSGIVSETLSKGIIESINNEIKSLI